MHRTNNTSKKKKKRVVAKSHTIALYGIKLKEILTEPWAADFTGLRYRYVAFLEGGVLLLCLVFACLFAFVFKSNPGGAVFYF